MKLRQRPLNRLVVVNYRASEDFFRDISGCFMFGLSKMEIYNNGFVDLAEATVGE